MRYVRFYPFTVLLLVVICCLSLMPAPKIEMVGGQFGDKWGHMVMYGALACVAFVESWRMMGRMPGVSVGLVVLLCSVILGGVLELLQAYCTVTRSGDWLDFGADGVGGVVGLLIGYAVGMVLFGRRGVR